MIIKQTSAEEISNKNERQSAKWDLHNAFRNYSTLIIAQATVAFFSFASIWLTTRYLGTEGYGAIVAVIAASQVAQIFVNWTCIALTRYGVEEFVETGKITHSFWARSLILLPNTLIFLAFSFLWLPLLSNWLKLPPETAWYIVAHFIVMALWLHVQNAIQGVKLPRLQGYLLAIERMLVFSILLILIWSGKLNYLSAISAYIVSPLLMSFIGLFQLRKLVSWRIKYDFGLLKKILKFSVPLIPFSLIGYFSTSYLDAIFISQYLSKSDLGIYSVVYQINGILMQIPTLAGSLLLPFFITLQTSKQDKIIEAYLQDFLPLATLIWGFGCVLFAAFIGYLLPLVFGEKFAAMGLILWVLIIGATFAIPVLIGYAPFINSRSATYIGMIGAIAAAIMNFIFDFLLIPKYGLTGCAWATVLAYGVSFLVILLLVHRRFSFKHTWTFQATLPALFAAGYLSLSGNQAVALIVAFSATMVLAFFYRKYIIQGIRILQSYRNFIS